jgi:hypothetical protein
MISRRSGLAERIRRSRVRQRANEQERRQHDGHPLDAVRARKLRTELDHQGRVEHVERGEKRHLRVGKASGCCTQGEKQRKGGEPQHRRRQRSVCPEAAAGDDR